MSSDVIWIRAEGIVAALIFIYKHTLHNYYKRLCDYIRTLVASGCRNFYRLLKDVVLGDRHKVRQHNYRTYNTK